jgi:hypothetical protein
MAEPTIWTAQVPNLEILEKAWSATAPRWVYAERMEEITLCWAADLVGGLAAWPAGRAFGPTLELRWEQIGHGYRLIFLSEEAAPPLAEELAWSKRATYLETVERWALLWGEYDAGTDTWFETQIPRPFAYPVDAKGQRVRLVGVDYRQNGVTIITRLKGVEPYEPAPTSPATAGGGT